MHFRAIYDSNFINYYWTDGGGPNAVSGLCIVDEIMERIAEDDEQDRSDKLNQYDGQDQDNFPRPCEHADLMIGTGLGGYVHWRYPAIVTILIASL